jgi:hypothetical protein
MKKFGIIIGSLYLTMLTSFVWAQAFDEETEERDEVNETDTDNGDKGFTGTYSEDDPDNEELYKEKQIFGPDEADDEEEPSEEESDAPYLLKFEMTGRLVVTSKLTGESTLEIDYHTVLEKEVDVTKKRTRLKGKAETTVETLGNFVSNNLVTCLPEVSIEPTTLSIMTKLNHFAETDTESERIEMALQIKPEEKIAENWFSNCLGVDQSVFNTSGPPEYHLNTILGSTDPSLTGIVFADFDPYGEASVDLSVETTEVDDIELEEIYTYYGEGKITVEYQGE